MKEILGALIDDTSRQILLMETAIREADSQKFIRLAHYSKGACANVGANAAAALLKEMEHQAGEGRLPACAASLAALTNQIDRLRDEVALV